MELSLEQKGNHQDLPEEGRAYLLEALVVSFLLEVVETYFLEVLEACQVAPEENLLVEGA